MAQKKKRKFEEKNCKTIKIHRLGAKNGTIFKIRRLKNKCDVDDPEKLAPTSQKLIFCNLKSTSSFILYIIVAKFIFKNPLLLSLLIYY
jgi:hypothetical protein